MRRLDLWLALGLTVAAAFALPFCGSDLGSSSPCANLDCSGHGACFAVGSVPYCECDDGYHPEYVECVANDVVDPCAGVLCDGHGTCRVVADDWTCDCETGYVFHRQHCIDLARLDADAGLPDARDGDDGEVSEDRTDGDDDTDVEADDDGTGTDTDDDAGADDVPPPPVCGNGRVEAGEECDGGSRACGLCDQGTRDCVDCHWSSTCEMDPTRCNDAADSIPCGTASTCLGTAWCNTTTCWWGACRCNLTSRSCTTVDGCSGTQTCTNGGSVCSWGSCTPTSAVCYDNLGRVVCSGRTGLYQSDCSIGVCRRCTCSSGSWTGCSSCAASC